MLDRFEYMRPTHLEELFSILANYGSRNVCVLAGGTDLIPALRAGKKHADCVVDLEGLGLQYISNGNGSIRIGAGATFRMLLRDGIIRSHLPILACAAGRIGAVQTQSLATIGGNLCSALPSADSAAPLLVLDAQLRLVSAGGERLVKIQDFFTGPGTTLLANGEILAEIVIPVSDGRRAAFMKVGRRKGMSLAVLNCAASFRLNAGGLIQDARIALGAAAPTPVRTARAEEFISGSQPSASLFAQAGKIAASELHPRSSIRASGEYRSLLSEILVRRSLQKTFDQFQVYGKEERDGFDRD